MASLQAAESRYKAIVEASDDLIYICSGACRIEFMNRRLIDKIGRDATGEECYRVLHDRDSICPWCVNERVFAGETVRWDVQSPKDGRWYHIVSAPIRNADGTVSKQSVITDINERKHAEEILRESEEQYRLLFENNPHSMWVYDIETLAFLAVNDTAVRRYGFTQAEFLRMTIRDIRPAEDISPLLEEVSGLPSEGLNRPGTWRHRRKDGSIIFVEIISRPILFAGRQARIVLAGDVTERKKAEAEREQYFNFFQASDDLMCIADPNGAFMKINPACSRTLGYSEAELISRPFIEFVHPDDRQTTADEMAKQLLRGYSLNFENRYLCKDGTVRWLSWRASYNRKEGLTYATARDITEIRQTEEALQDSRAALKQILDTLPQSIFWKDRNGVYLGCNEVFARAAGLSDAEQIKGKTDFDLPWPKEEAEAYRADDREVVIGNHPKYHIIEPLQQGDGRRLWIDTTKVPLLDGHGIVKGLLGVYEDITERREAEEALKMSEQFTRNILDTVDEGFIVVDRDFRIITANKAYCAQVGMSCDEVLGRHCYEISHKSARPCYEKGEECSVRRVFDEGQPHVSVHTHTDAKGNLVYFETKAFPIKDSSDAITSAIETVNNITEKHLLEEERLKTQKLEAIGTLAGGIAHDFNNLLQGVFGYISMARLTHDQKDRSLAMLEQAEQALHMSVNLTTQLLTFSKGGKPAKKKISLRPVVENSVRFSLSGSSSSYNITFGEGLWAVDADEGQIGQVIQNIVLNADQSMPLGGTIEISVKNVPGPVRRLPQLRGEKYVDISIRDSGTGMDAGLLRKIFDPYFTTREKGSGLGLATAYSIIKNHGGAIDVVSVPGEGTTFSVYLPATEMEKESAAETVVQIPDRKGRILVMDDEELIRNIAGELIGALGHEVDYAECGESALEKYRRAKESGNPFDIVILDLTIRGGMGGKETLERLLLFDPGVRAIVSSGYSDDSVVSDYNKYGFRSRLTKPYTLEALRNALNELLRTPEP